MLRTAVGGSDCNVSPFGGYIDVGHELCWWQRTGWHQNPEKNITLSPISLSLIRLRASWSKKQNVWIKPAEWQNNSHRIKWKIWSKVNLTVHLNFKIGYLAEYTPPTHCFLLLKFVLGIYSKEKLENRDMKTLRIS